VSLYKQYFTIIGLLVLSVVICVLLLPQSMILARTATFIDTTSQWASSEKTLVQTKLDLGSSEHIREFPKVIGEWTGIDYEVSQIEEMLNADVILMRAYQSSSFYQPIFLLIMQSSESGSFHPPPQCYSSLGYQIEEEGKEEIHLSNVDWVSFWRSKAEQGIATSINVNKLVVFKESEGEVTERRVVLYFYVKETLTSKDKLTMVRVSLLAPIDMSYDGVLSLAKDFMGEVVPNLFEFYEETDEMLAAYLAKSVAGWLIMAVSLVIPFAIMFYPRWRRW
jgi:hypothetical protein